MKIALVSSVPVPHAFGGMDRLLDGLTLALRRHHPTDLVTLPVDERSAEGVLKGYHDFYRLDLNDYDAVISCKGPAYLLNHPVHVVYLSHRMRVFYDRYEPRDNEHARLRRLIHWLDGWALDPKRIPRVFTIGQTVSRRLLKWGGIESTPIHLPSTFEPIAPHEGQYFLAVGRLHPWKRFDLIIRAMRAARGDVPLWIVGEGPDEERLRELAGNDKRIHFAGQVNEERLREAYAKAIATIFPPIEEDLGLITFESFLSGKPVLTVTDAGEAAEIVRDGATGFVTAPTPEALAEKIDWLTDHPDEARRMGEAGGEDARQVTWDGVVDRLLEAIDQTRRDRKSGGGGDGRDKKYHLLVTDNQIIDPPLGGGRMRIWELYRHLPEDFVTTYIGAHDHPGPQFRDQWLAPNFREIIMPLTMMHFKMHEIWRRLTRGDATVDVTIPLLLGRCSPRYRRLIEEHLPGTDALVCAHPWMFPFLPAPDGLPRVYDSQNCEAVVKGALLRRTLAGRYLARRVERTERLAATNSHLTLACSEADTEQFILRYGVAPERILSTPNGVDCERIRPADPDAKTAARRRLDLPDRPLALFVGSNYEPNLEAAACIVERLAPDLVDMTFAIVGGVGPMWTERYPGVQPPANVRLAGFVEADALLDYYRAADVAINPVSVGSGTNIKMLDYMAAGLPIVSTEVGARGIDGRDGEHWRIASIQMTTAVLCQLNGSPETCRAMGETARRLAEERYDWRCISARLADRLRQLIDQSKSVVESP